MAHKLFPIGTYQYRNDHDTHQSEFRAEVKIGDSVILYRRNTKHFGDNSRFETIEVSKVTKAQIHVSYPTSYEPRIRRFNKSTGLEVGSAHSRYPTILLVLNDQIADAWEQHLEYVAKRTAERDAEADRQHSVRDARQHSFWHKASIEEVAQIAALMEKLQAERV